MFCVHEMRGFFKGRFENCHQNLTIFSEIPTNLHIVTVTKQWCRVQCYAIIIFPLVKCLLVDPRNDMYFLIIIIIWNYSKRALIASSRLFPLSLSQFKDGVTGRLARFPPRSRLAALFFGKKFDFFKWEARLPRLPKSRTLPPRYR